MSFVERAKEVPAVRKSAFERVLDGLPESEREALIKMCADPAWSNRRIIEACQEEGISTSKDSVGSFRIKLRKQMAAAQ